MRVILNRINPQAENIFDVHREKNFRKKEARQNIFSTFKYDV